MRRTNTVALAAISAIWWRLALVVLAAERRYQSLGGTHLPALSITGERRSWIGKAIPRPGCNRVPIRLGNGAAGLQRPCTGTVGIAE